MLFRPIHARTCADAEAAFPGLGWGGSGCVDSRQEKVEWLSRKRDSIAGGRRRLKPDTQAAPTGIFASVSRRRNRQRTADSGALGAHCLWRLPIIWGSWQRKRPPETPSRYFAFGHRRIAGVGKSLVRRAATNSFALDSCLLHGGCRLMHGITKSQDGRRDCCRCREAAGFRFRNPIRGGLAGCLVKQTLPRFEKIMLRNARSEYWRKVGWDTWAWPWYARLCSRNTRTTSQLLGECNSIAWSAFRHRLRVP